jgi:hypothetical protein
MCEEMDSSREMQLQQNEEGALNQKLEASFNSDSSTETCLRIEENSLVNPWEMK